MTERDAQILRETNAEKIESLRPLTAIPGWETTFASEAERLEREGRARRDGSDEQRESFEWAFAHRALLEDVDSEIETAREP